LEPGWQQEPLANQVTRVITRLHLDTCPPKSQRLMHAKSSLLPAPSFAFCFPLLRNVLEDKIAGVSQDETLKLKCFAIISAHCGMREDPTSEDAIDEVRHLDFRRSFYF
jgi:hypothetical protein